VWKIDSLKRRISMAEDSHVCCRVSIEIGIIATAELTTNGFHYPPVHNQIKMCIINHNLYACKHTVVLSVDRCPQSLQGLPCSNVWKAEGYRLGECMLCVMEEPAGQALSSPDSPEQWSALDASFHGHKSKRESRFPMLKGCQWHTGFPQSRTTGPRNCKGPR